MDVYDCVWIPWRQRVGKLPDPAAAAPLSDYRSVRLHAAESAHSKRHTHARKRITHIHAHRPCSNGKLEITQRTDMLRSKTNE